ncbi:hypothetical protein LINGRAHAP2_LOCUS10639 [Linum grandiflorum]
MLIQSRSEHFPPRDKESASPARLVIMGQELTRLRTSRRGF